MSLRLRILISLISVAFFSVLFVAGLSLYVLNTVSKDILTEDAQANLKAELVNTSDAIDTYIGNISAQITNKANNQYWQQAANDFMRAFSQYSEQRSPISSADMAELEAYYKNEFSEVYAARNNSTIANLDDLLSPLSNNAKALQYDFIASSSFEIGNKDGLSRLPNTTTYASVHADFHPLARRFLQDFGYYDVFIADANSGNIVYSVFKELDYATNLKTGPYADTGIGHAFAKANASLKPDTVYYSSLSPYLPSYNAMAGFIAAPMYVNEQKVAVLIFQIPLDRVNNVLTRNSNWRRQGFGESGETYLVNTDKELVTESRFFIEDKKAYLNAIAGSMPAIAKAVDSAGTSVGIQTADTNSVNEALLGNAGFNMITDYRGVRVFSAYQPFILGDTSYALIAEIDEEEALQSAMHIQERILWAVIMVAVVILGLALGTAVVITNRINRPLRAVNKVCENLSSGDGDLTMRLRPCGIAEIDRLLSSVNVFVEQVHGIITTISGDSEALASASEELTVVTTQTRENAVEQRNQTNTVSDSVDELSRSIKDISETVAVNRDQSEEVNKKLSEHLGKTDVAAQKLRDLVVLIRDSRDTINGLRQEVTQVTGLLEDINSIADQTNLLALNAAIEAARAGEAGRGFSVVADEVRTLATRSQESTGQISKIIELMTTASNNSVDIMENAVSSADQGIEIVDTITEALNNLGIALSANQQLAIVVANATDLQTETSNTVRDSIHNIATMAHDAENGAIQSNEAATELARIASKSVSIVSKFKI